MQFTERYDILIDLQEEEDVVEWLNSAYGCRMNVYFL